MIIWSGKPRQNRAISNPKAKDVEAANERDKVERKKREAGKNNCYRPKAAGLPLLCRPFSGFAGKGMAGSEISFLGLRNMGHSQLSTVLFGAMRRGGVDAW